jgi:two-component system LytT family response regulator
MKTNQEGLDILIVDDENKACNILKNILIKYVDVQINTINVANNTREADEQLRTFAPDVVFLDIEMPNENAFLFLERIAPFSFEVIFVTAFDEYAVKAFKLNAVDYVLKPISISDLQNAVIKLQERLKYKRTYPESRTLFSELSFQVQNKVKHHKIILRDKNNTEVIDFKDILFVEADGSYSRMLFLKDNLIREITMSWLLSDYEEVLPADQFFRIHRSYLINCTHIVKIQKEETNYVVLNNNFKLMVSRRNYGPLLSFLKTNDFHYE